MGEFLRIACEGAVVRRATGFALVVGAVLIAINHGDRLLGAGDPLGARDLLKMGLTLGVPYVVSTLSSVGAIRQYRGSGGRRPGREA